MEIVDVPWDSIEPNPENPNEMGEAEMKALRADIERRGFVQPVALRPLGGGRYMLIDGFHRWQILGELGMETVPSVIEEDADEDEGALRMVTMNFLRGNFVPIRLAHVVADLAERIPESELRERLAMDQSTLQNYLGLASYLDEADDNEGTPRPSSSGEPDDRVEIAVVATGPQARRINELLEELTGGDSEREPAVLARKAREWLA